MKRRRVHALVLLLLITGMVLYPMVWAVINSLKSSRELAMDPMGLPTSLRVENYVEAWTQGNMARYMWNSVVIALPTVAAVLTVSVLGGYAFAQLTFAGRNSMYLYVVAGLAIPFVVIIIPLYFQMRTLGLLNSYWSVILPQVAIILPFGTLLARSFMVDIPRSVLDAGIIDGCNSFQLLRHIVVPAIGPALSSLAIFAFMWTWNQLFLPMVMITQSAYRPIPVGLTYFQTNYGMNIPVVAAGAVIASLPVVLVYMAFQRHFIRGLTVGAVKG
jgi:raffinose/stachyose/melibiose transport system permease protein